MASVCTCTQNYGEETALISQYKLTCEDFVKDHLAADTTPEHLSKHWQLVGDLQIILAGNVAA